MSPDLEKRRRIERFVSMCRRHVASYSIVSTEPLIFHLLISPELSDFMEDYDLLFDFLKNRKAYFLCQTETYFEDPQDTERLKALIESFRSRCPDFTFMFLANTPNQHLLFTENKLESVFCSSNCFVDEDLYFPLPGTEKHFDAVYDARLVDWKRHDLAARVDSLALIYYGIPWKEDAAYMDKIKGDFAHAHFFNHPRSAEYQRLAPSDVNKCLNQCRVGLCLSEKEGAMYASIQYLLAGLPVVTVPSIGGRDEFFDDEIALTVRADAEAVKEGVDEMVARNLSPAMIRQRTLERINQHRKNFIELGQEIYDREGVQKDFADQFKKIFFDKLFRKQNHGVTIQMLAALNLEQR